MKISRENNAAQLEGARLPFACRVACPSRAEWQGCKVAWHQPCPSATLPLLHHLQRGKVAKLQSRIWSTLSLCNFAIFASVVHGRSTPITTKMLCAFASLRLCVEGIFRTSTCLPLCNLATLFHQRSRNAAITVKIPKTMPAIPNTHGNESAARNGFATKMMPKTMLSTPRMPTPQPPP
jgi:hypothetical protein